MKPEHDAERAPGELPDGRDDPRRNRRERRAPREIGGAQGPEPTRYGDWEHKGRCTDF